MTLWEALYAYQGRRAGELSLQPGDLVEAAKGAELPRGWLLGTNRCTGVSGYLPASYVRPLDASAVQLLPPLRVREEGNDSGYCELVPASPPSK